MRLLNTTSLQLEEVADSELSDAKNQYAILSHRWGIDEDEVSYLDVISQKDLSLKKGYIKIREFCSIASRSGYRYGWCDTCCINKGNSSELAESINSMYMWYKMSSLCVVYLTDVPTVQLKDSEWFDRGWTLQELIAPAAVSFFNHDWQLVGTKLELLDSLSEKTGVPSDVLGNTAAPWTCSVAQRMSWAAHRITKRVEDRAYSLLGLFEVNMPMIYGERDKAFLRLQQNIALKSKDESLFAWSLDPFTESSNIHSKEFFSIFASSPSAFRNCRNRIPTPGSTGFTQNNGELAIKLRVCRWTPGIFDALLHCTDERSPKKKFAISISKTFAQDTYVRVRDLENINQGLRDEDSGKERLLHFVIEPKSPPVNIIHGFWLRTLQPPGHDVSDVSIVSNSTPLENGYIQQIDRKGDSGIVQLQPKPTSFPLNWSRIRWMRFWFSASNDPVVWIGNDTQTEKLRTFYDEMLTIEQSESKVREGKFKALHNSFWEAPEGKEKVEFDARDVGHDWPHGNAIIPVNRKKGLHEFILPNLNLQVSVRLQPYHNPKIEASRLNNQGRSQNTTLVWVVDITSPDARRFYPSQPLQMKWSHWFVNLFCFACIQTCQSEGCALCLCCCWCTCKEYAKLHPRYNLTCYDFFYPCCQGRWLKEKEAKAKIAYAKEAGSKIPRLKPGASTVYALTTIRPMYDCQEDCLKWVGTSNEDYKRTMKGE